MIFIPGTGIIVCKMAFSYPDSTIANNVAAYTNEATGQLRPEFNEALAMFCWAWFILTVIYTIAAVRSSWVLFLTLFFLDVELVLLAAGYMANSSKVLTAANSVGFVVGFFSCE
jgi:succinate-acetate transporter protein